MATGFVVVVQSTMGFVLDSPQAARPEIPPTRAAAATVRRPLIRAKRGGPCLLDVMLNWRSRDAKNRWPMEERARGRGCGDRLSAVRRLLERGAVWRGDSGLREGGTRCGWRQPVQSAWKAKTPPRKGQYAKQGSNRYRSEPCSAQYRRRSGGPGIRTLMSFRTPVFKTGALAVLPTLQSAAQSTLTGPDTQGVAPSPIDRALFQGKAHKKVLIESAQMTPNSSCQGDNRRATLPVSLRIRESGSGIRQRDGWSYRTTFLWRPAWPRCGDPAGRRWK